MRKNRIEWLAVGLLIFLSQPSIAQPRGGFGYKSSYKLRNGLIPAPIRTRKQSAGAFFTNKVNPSKTPASYRGGSYSGINTDKHGNKLGGSGLPRIYNKKFSSRKKAYDASSLYTKKRPEFHSQQYLNRPRHFHAIARDGKKRYKAPHFIY